MEPTNNGDQPRPGRPILLTLVGVFFACAVLHGVLYGPTIARATFLGDDWFHIEKIPAERIPHLFYGDWHLGYRHVQGAFYRPLPRILMQIGRRCFDQWTPGYLVLPALFHFLNCALIWLLVWRLSDRGQAAWIAALAYAVFPTHHEALLQISTLADSMAVCGILLALAGVVETHNSGGARGYAMLASGMLLGALSKESWVTLPFLVAWFEGLWRGDSRRLLPGKSGLLRIGACVAFALAYVVFRQSALGSTGGYAIPLTLDSIRRTYDATFRVIALPLPSIGKWSELFNVITVLCIQICAWALLGFPRLALFGIGWMLLTTLPFVRLIPDVASGRLIYVVVIGWVLFLGGIYDGLLNLGKTARDRRTIGVLATVGLFVPLVVANQFYCADWRTSYSINRRLVTEMADEVAAHPDADRFAVLNWPVRIGAADSNRVDSAARAIARMADAPTAQIEPLLAADSPEGTITFSVVEDRWFRPGIVKRTEEQVWAGAQVKAWEVQNQARLAQMRSDGSPDFWCESQGDGLLSPTLDGGSGFYSVQSDFRSVKNPPAQVMWSGPGKPFDRIRRAHFLILGRPNQNVRVANIGWASGLDRVLFLPCVVQDYVTVRSIRITRFQIGPLPRSNSD